MEKGLLNSKFAFLLTGLLLGASSPAYASAPLCPGTLLVSATAPSKEQFQTAIQNLAKLRLDLDLHKNDNSKVSNGMVKILAQKYQSELFNLQEAMKDKYKPEEIKGLIAEEIAVLQGHKVREIETEVQELQHQRKILTENYDDIDFIDKTMRDRVANFTVAKLTAPRSFLKEIISVFHYQAPKMYAARGATYDPSPLTGTDKALRDLSVTTEQDFVHIELLNEAGERLAETTDVSGESTYAFKRALAVTLARTNMLKIKKCIITFSYLTPKSPSLASVTFPRDFLDIKASLEAMAFDDVSVEGNVLFINNQIANKLSMQIPYSSTVRKGDYELGLRPPEQFHKISTSSGRFVPNTEYGDFTLIRRFAAEIASNPRAMRESLMTSRDHFDRLVHDSESPYLEPFEKLLQQYRN